MTTESAPGGPVIYLWWPATIVSFLFYSMSIVVWWSYGRPFYSRSNGHGFSSRSGRYHHHQFIFRNIQERTI